MKYIFITILMSMLLLAGCVSTPEVKGPASTALTSIQSQVLADKVNNLEGQYKTLDSALKQYPKATELSKSMSIITDLSGNITSIRGKVVAIEADIQNNKVSAKSIEDVKNQMKALDIKLSVLQQEYERLLSNNVSQIMNISITPVAPLTCGLANLNGQYPQSLNYNVALTNTTTKDAYGMEVSGYITFDRAISLAAGYPVMVDSGDATINYVLTSGNNNQYPFIVQRSGKTLTIPAGKSITLKPRVNIQSAAADANAINATLVINFIGYTQ